VVSVKLSKLQVLTAAAIPAIILLCYILLAGPSFFTPQEAIVSLGARQSNLFNVFTYYLVHTGHQHLFFNLAALLLFGAVLTSVFERRHLIGLFFFSAILSALVGVLVFPNVVFVGASAASSAMIAVALMTRPKQAVVALVLTGILITGVLSPVSEWNYTEFISSLTQKQEQLEMDLNRATQAGDLNRATAIRQQLVETKHVKQRTLQDEARVKQIPISNFMHFLGSVLGLLYAFKFKRKEMFAGMDSIRFGVRSAFKLSK